MNLNFAMSLGFPRSNTNGSTPGIIAAAPATTTGGKDRSLKKRRSGCSNVEEKLAKWKAFNSPREDGCVPLMLPGIEMVEGEVPRSKGLPAKGSRKGCMKGKGGPQNSVCRYRGVRQRTWGKWATEIRQLVLSFSPVKAVIGLAFLFYLETSIRVFPQPVRIFISHRGPDTKNGIAALIDRELVHRGFIPILDSMSFDLGDRITWKIKEEIQACDIAIVIFSPRFCESKHTLNEVVLLLEMNKTILPVFWNIEPSEVKSSLENYSYRFPESDMQRYRTAIKEAVDIIGLPFQSEVGNWAKVLDDIVKAIYKISSKLREGSER